MQTNRYETPVACICLLPGADILTTSGIGLVVSWEEGEEVG